MFITSGFSFSYEFLKCISSKEPASSFAPVFILSRGELFVRCRDTDGDGTECVKCSFVICGTRGDKPNKSSLTVKGKRGRSELTATR